MTSVPSSPPPLPGGVSLALLEAPPAAANEPARGAGRVGAAGDAVIEAAAAKVGASKSKAKATQPSKASAAKKKSSSTGKAGYAAAGSLPKDLAFLRDAKLSVEEKLMRFLAYLNAKGEAEITKKMEEMGGGAPAKSGGTTGGASGGTKPKTKGFWGKLLDAAKTGLPAIGLTFQMLKNPTTKAMLRQLGGPVLAAAAAALGFPAAAPVIAKLGPQLVDYAAAGLQAVEKAAAAEQQGAGGASGGSGSGSGSSGTSGTGSGKSEQLQLVELNRLVAKQNEMFALASNLLKSWHDTRSQIINNLR